MTQHLAASRYHEWAASTAQQCAEKAVKALTDFLQGATRGHSITPILQQLPESLQVPSAVPDSARELDQVCVTARYSNGFTNGSPTDYFGDKTGERLLGNARNALEFCRRKIY